jgi:phage-related holin
MNWIKAAAISIFAILAPIHSVMAVAGIMIVVDLITGVLAARKRGEIISSAALRRTVSKMLVYQSAIVTGFLCEHYLLSDTLPIVKLIAAAIGLVEMKSITENLNELNGAPIFKSLIESLGSKNSEPPK